MTKNAYEHSEDYKALMANMRRKERQYTSLMWRIFRWLIDKILGERWENPI